LPPNQGILAAKNKIRALRSPTSIKRNDKIVMVKGVSGKIRGE